MQQLTIEQLARAFGVTLEDAQQAVDKLGYLYRQPATQVIEWVKSSAVPQGVAIVTSQGIVVWLGPANQLPNEMPWPDPVKVNCDPTTYHIVAMKAKMLEEGTPAK